MAIDFSAYMEIDLPVSVAMLRNDVASMISRPLIYLYVLSVIYSDFKLQKKHLLHLSWVVITLIIMSPIYIGDDEGKIQFRDDIYNYDKMHAKFIYDKSL